LLSGRAQAAVWADEVPTAQPGWPRAGLRLRLPISAFSAAPDGSARAYSALLAPADHGRLTTTIDYRLAPSGPVGSVGLQSLKDGPVIDPSEMNRAAAAGRGVPEATVGARLSYHF
jgi:hypothetical protein